MKVIYDISPVGNRPETRTGLARSAWSTAYFLQQRLGCNLSFSATGSIWASIQTEDLLSKHPEFSSANNPVSYFTKLIYQYQEQLAEPQNHAEGVHRTVSAVNQKVLIGISRLLNMIRTPINSHVLKAADIYHSSYARIPPQVRRALPGRHILTVNDLTPLILDEHYFVPGQRTITRRIIDSIQPEDWVITISESTRRDLCERRRVNPERVVTIPLAASKKIFYPVDNLDEILKIRAKYQIPKGDYLLTLHSLAPHKNLSHLIHYFNEFVQQQKITNVSLVICGGQGQNSTHFAKMLNLDETDLKQVHFTGYVDEADLAAIYSGARAFVFPSLYEGFGLPVLEAMQCGCPVISSNTSSLPEIVGGAGILFPPNNKDDLHEALLGILSNHDLHQELRLLGMQRANLFCWEKTVTRILELYRQVVN